MLVGLEDAKAWPGISELGPIQVYGREAGDHSVQENPV